jgi:hypothetical protein
MNPSWHTPTPAAARHGWTTPGSQHWCPAQLPDKADSVAIPRRRHPCGGLLARDLGQVTKPQPVGPPTPGKKLCVIPDLHVRSRYNPNRVTSISGPFHSVTGLWATKTTARRSRRRSGRFPPRCLWHRRHPQLRQKPAVDQGFDRTQFDLIPFDRSRRAHQCPHHAVGARHPTQHTPAAINGCREVARACRQSARVEVTLTACPEGGKDFVVHRSSSNLRSTRRRPTVGTPTDNFGGSDTSE